MLHKYYRGPSQVAHFKIVHGKIKAFKNYSRFNTLSSLAVTFNEKPKSKNQFFKSECGLFKISELRNPYGFHFLKENAEKEAEELVKEGCCHERSRKMVEIFDHLSNTLCKVADLAEFVRMTHPDAEYSRAAEDACITISGLVEKLNTNRELYDALKRVTEEGDVISTTDVDQHVSTLFLFDFEQSGIHLNEMDRRKVTLLNDNILQAGQMFVTRSSAPRSVDKSILPEDIRHHFAIDGNNITIPGYFSDSHSELTREAAFRIFLLPESLQEDTLSNLLLKRKQLASLCGFPSYSHRTLRGSVAESPDMVNNFLNILSKEIKHSAAGDFQEMNRMKKNINKGSKSLGPWDVPYFTGLARRKIFPSEIENDKISSYFSLGTVMEGFSNLIRDLFGVYLKPMKPHIDEVWSPDVHKLAVVRENEEKILGYIYCDFFERKGKSFHDCHFTIQGGKELPDGTYQDPIVALHLNLPPPTWSTPSLLSLSMVENLFHELGHAMHSMLARTKYQHVTGTRCCTDFAEVPSILNEFFANDARVLHRFAIHYKTGEQLPIEVLQKVLTSRNVFPYAELQLQVFYSVLDQKFHGKDISFTTSSTTDMLAEIQNEYYSLPYVPNTAWQLRFSHLVGYGAKYYSYLLSKAIASWIWQSYFSQDPFNSDMGRKLEREVLRHGGGKPPQSMISEYLGKRVTEENLVSALVYNANEKAFSLKSISK